MRRTLIVLVTAALAIGAGIPAGAGSPDGARPSHLALGDSVAVGTGASNPGTAGYAALFGAEFEASYPCVPPSGIDPPGTDQSESGCPGLLTTNLAVNGATSWDVVTSQLPTALAEVGARNGDLNPRDDVEVITIDVGGNDVFQPVLAACADGIDEGCTATIQSTFGAYATNFGFILYSLRDAAGPDTPIVTMTYYNSLLACNMQSLAPLAEVVLEGEPQIGLPYGLNDIIRSTAAAFDVRVAETHGLLGPDDLVGGTDCLHPDDSGHALIAGAFIEALGG